MTKCRDFLNVFHFSEIPKWVIEERGIFSVIRVIFSICTIVSWSKQFLQDLLIIKIVYYH